MLVAVEWPDEEGGCSPSRRRREEATREREGGKRGGGEEEVNDEIYVGWRLQQIAGDRPAHTGPAGNNGEAQLVGKNQPNFFLSFFRAISVLGVVYIIILDFIYI